MATVSLYKISKLNNLTTYRVAFAEVSCSRLGDVKEVNDGAAMPSEPRKRLFVVSQNPWRDLLEIK